MNRASRSERAAAGRVTNPLLKLVDLQKISDIEVHIFSKTFYLVGIAQDILNRSMERLQFSEKHDNKKN